MARNISTTDSKARNIYVANLIKKGWGSSDINHHLQEKYNISEVAANKIYRRTVEWLCLYDTSKFVEEVRATQMARLEHILQKAMERDDYKTANSIIETINKTCKLYDTVQRVELTNSTVQFKFKLEKEEEKEEIKPDFE